MRPCQIVAKRSVDHDLGLRSTTNVHILRIVVARGICCVNAVHSSRSIYVLGCAPAFRVYGYLHRLRHPVTGWR